MQKLVVQNYLKILGGNKINTKETIVVGALDCHNAYFVGH
jgi:hypothetical protein